MLSMGGTSLIFTGIKHRHYPGREPRRARNSPHDRRARRHAPAFRASALV
ncbi:MAG: hypothetical protein WKG07_22280 [Hymenobacter sp.]